MTEYKPEVGDTVKVEMGVLAVHRDGSLTLHPLRDMAGGTIATNPGTKVEFARRKAPVLEAGDIVHYKASGGVYLVGFKQVSYTVPHGEIVDGGTVQGLADKIARHPAKYTVVKHERNTK